MIVVFKMNLGKIVLLNSHLVCSPELFRTLNGGIVGDGFCSSRPPLGIGQQMHVYSNSHGTQTSNYQKNCHVHITTEGHVAVLMLSARLRPMSSDC